jgi:hypothetical protein
MVACVFHSRRERGLIGVHLCCFDLICRCFGCKADVESEISVMVADWGTCDKQARRDKIVTG